MGTTPDTSQNLVWRFCFVLSQVIREKKETEHRLNTISLLLIHQLKYHYSCFALLACWFSFIFFCRQSLSVHWSTLQQLANLSHSLQQISLCWNNLLNLEASPSALLSAWTTRTRTDGFRSPASETRSSQSPSLHIIKWVSHKILKIKLLIFLCKIRLSPSYQKIHQ